MSAAPARGGGEVMEGSEVESGRDQGRGLGFRVRVRV